jgi:hypothetical protein
MPDKHDTLAALEGAVLRAQTRLGARCLYEDYIKAIEDGSWPET